MLSEKESKMLLVGAVDSYVATIHMWDKANQLEYQAAVAILQLAQEGVTSQDELSEHGHDFANDLCEEKVHMLIEWLSADPKHIDFVDEACREFLVNCQSGLIDRLRAGQYVQAFVVYNDVLQEIRQIVQEGIDGPR